MNGEVFADAARQYLVPVLEPLGFEGEIRVSGRLYSADFSSSSHVISVSFEPGSDYWLVVVHTVTNGLRSDLDDVARTPRLKDINAKYLTDRDGPTLRALQRDKATNDSLTRQIRRIAAELSVVLPRYLTRS